MTPDEAIILECRKRFGVEILRVSLASKIPESLLAAFACTESYPKLYKQSARFEQHIFDEFYPLQKLSGQDVLLAASSHGLCQVMGAYVHEFRFLGKSRFLGECGRLPEYTGEQGTDKHKIDIRFLYERPFDACALHLQKVANAMPYIEKKDFESVARIYNSGNPNNKTKQVTQYWLTIQKYITLYDEVKKIPMEDLPQ